MARRSFARTSPIRSRCRPVEVVRSSGVPAEKGDEPHHAPLAGAGRDDGQIRAVDVAMRTGNGQVRSASLDMAQERDLEIEFLHPLGRMSDLQDELPAVRAVEEKRVVFLGLKARGRAANIIETFGDYFSFRCTDGMAGFGKLRRAGWLGLLIVTHFPLSSGAAETGLNAAGFACRVPNFVQQSVREFKIGFWFDRKGRGSLDPFWAAIRQVSGPVPSPKITKYR